MGTSSITRFNDQKLQKTAFGELDVAETTHFIQNTAAYGLIPNNFRSYVNGTGSADVENSMFTCSTGTTVFSYSAIQSFRSLNYNAGQGGIGKFTFLFETGGIENAWQGVGLVSLTDELSFGYNGADFGIWYRHHGVAEVRTITITAPASGTTNLTLTLNGVIYTIPLTAATTTGVAYQIEQWLNANQNIWVADQIDGSVIISSQSDGPKTGLYSYSHATSTGTITQNTLGVTKESEHIPQADWNTNTCSWLNPQRGNVAKITYQYLGFGDIFFSLENPDTGFFEVVHVLKNANQRIKPSLINPSLRFGMYCYSLGSTTNIKVQCASVGLGVQGAIHKTRNPRAVKNTQTVSGANFINILTLRNRRTYNYIYNQVEIEPLNITIASESNKVIEVELRSNPTITGTTNFLPAGNNLVSDIDTTNTVISGGVLLAAFSVPANGSVSVNLRDLEIRIPPSLKVSLCVKNPGAAASITGTFTYYEDL